MRVAIDLTGLLGNVAGVGRYMLRLVSSLAALDRENDYLLFTNFEDRRRFRALVDASPASVGSPANFRIVPLSFRPRLVRLAFQHVLQPAALPALGCDVLHSPLFIMPLLRGGRRHVLTVHDMTSFLLPETHPPQRRAAYALMTAASIRRADIVCVPTGSVKEEILKLLPDVPPESVRVIPHGLDEAFKPVGAANVRIVLERLGLRSPYILYVGTLDPRKNLVRLLDSYRRLLAQWKRSEHLVLAGQFGWSPGEVQTRVAAADLRDRVHLLGYMDDDDLPALYSGARLFAYPSLGEGFGFPPLEAMACGVPVVASRTSALEENLSGAAELVPVEDVDALADAMQRLLADEDLRARRIEAGLARAARFHWEACARETLECYRELAARSRSPRKVQPGSSEQGW